MKKRTLQEIFDAVIDAGHYPYSASMGLVGSSDFMCLALKRAQHYNTINAEEHTRAANSINKYLEALKPIDHYADPLFLSGAWIVFGIVSSDLPKDKLKAKLLACYRDWANRPYKHRALKTTGKK